MRLTEIKITMLPGSLVDPAVSFVVTQSHPGETGAFVLPQSTIDALKDAAQTVKRIVESS